jgi:hypothetical protein
MFIVEIFTFTIFCECMTYAYDWDSISDPTLSSCVRFQIVSEHIVADQRSCVSGCHKILKVTPKQNDARR